MTGPRRGSAGRAASSSAASLELDGLDLVRGNGEPVHDLVLARELPDLDEVTGDGRDVDVSPRALDLADEWLAACLHADRDPVPDRHVLSYLTSRYWRVVLPLALRRISMV